MTSAQEVLNRFPNSSAVSPSTRIIFFRLVSPDAMVTEERGAFKRFAKNSMQASFARPSTGGAVRDSFRASPSSPVMAFFLARGWTLTAKVTPAAVSWIGIINFELSPRRHGVTKLGNPRPERNTTTGVHWLPTSSLYSASSVGSSPWAENRCPHTDASRGFFNRDFEIVRHAHGEHVHADGGQLARPYLIPQFAQPAKIG